MTYEKQVLFPKLIEHFKLIFPLSIIDFIYL